MDYSLLLKIKFPLKITYLFITIIFIGSFIYVSFLKCYDTFTYKGIVNNELIYINVPTNYLDTLLNGKFIKINKVKYNYEILSLGEVELDKDSYLYYQMVCIKVDKKFLNNEVLTITAYANQEKIIQKVGKFIRKE